MRLSPIEPREITTYITLLGEFPRNVKTYKELLDQYGSINEEKLRAVLREMVTQDQLIHDTQYNLYKVRAKAPALSE